MAPGTTRRVFSCSVVVVPPVPPYRGEEPGTTHHHRFLGTTQEPLGTTQPRPHAPGWQQVGRRHALRRPNRPAPKSSIALVVGAERRLTARRHHLARRHQPVIA